MISLFKKYSSLSIIIIVCMIFSSCKKDKPEVSSTPEISFISATPGTVIEYQDSLVLKISYKDGDGDLGENNPDVKNLFVTDNRIGITYPFRIQQLAPTGSTISIEGELNAVINNLAITDAGNSQTATFTIYVKDRAGNQSNSVTSSDVTIIK
ncbi:MAG: hypothetical protein ABI723_16010 [Bacteroidia bacterium]